MLSGLAVFAAITAMIAGVAGAWSPCGFSMVETIGGAVGSARRLATLTASATFALGTLIGGAVTFGGLALAGDAVGPQVSGLREGLGAALALAAALADWRGLRIAPQIRRQVPECWRWTMPLPLACALYGVLLGLGFTTFVLAFAVWALAGISFAAGDPALGVLIGVAFGFGRAAPVVWMAPGLRGGQGGRWLDGMAGEPRLWLGLRRLDALGLGLCAVALGGASANAHAAGQPPPATAPAPAGALVLVNAIDPSAAGANVAWQAIGGPGVLRTPTNPASALPGGHPALGQSRIAWEQGGVVTVAETSSMTPIASIPVTSLDALAVSDGWMVYRDRDERGGENLVGVSLTAPPQRRYIFGASRLGAVGRPALDGSMVVFAVATARHNAIEMMDLASGRLWVLRSVRRGAALGYPSLLGGRLLYVWANRCAQQLRIGPAMTPRADRPLLRLPSTALRDRGYERGYTRAYNRASLCANRAPIRGSALRLGPTALSADAAYVTETPRNSADARVIQLPR